MTTEDAKIIQERLDLISAAAKKYGDTAQQLNNAKDSVVSLTEIGKESVEKILNLISVCEDYISCTKELIEKDYSEQVSIMAEKANKIIDNSQEKCNEIGGLAERTISNVIVQNKETFDKIEHSVLEKLDVSENRTLNIAKETLLENLTQTEKLILNAKQEILFALEKTTEDIDKNQKALENWATLFDSRLSKNEKQNKLFFYINIGLSSLIIILILLGFFI